MGGKLRLIASITVSIASLAFFGLALFFFASMFLNFQVAYIFGSFFSGLSGYYLLYTVDTFAEKEDRKELLMCQLMWGSDNDGKEPSES